MKNYIIGMIGVVAIAITFSGGIVGAADYTPASAESAVTLTGVVVMTNAAVSMTNLPTATTGLAAGRLWSNSNVVTVVQ